MTTTTEPESENQTKEWVDKVVLDTFNELLIEISSKSKLHPAEQMYRNEVFSENSNTKIYDIINSYHAYCKLCDQHFYTRSIASDINSFFQKHLNTSYHRQIRAVCPISDNTPIMTWEKKLETGRCNLCEMSDINSYIIDTDFDSRKLIRAHVCFWDHESRETNEKLLRKFILLKKYCGLSIFREKYIKVINKQSVCLLCKKKLSWPNEKAFCHLSCDTHYQSFCAFLLAQFSFLPKDVLNGFNLELITRWLVTFNPLPVKEFSDFDERTLCIQRSSSDENPYSEERGNFSFTPKMIEKLSKNLDADFIHENKCLLCNEALTPGHFTTELHLSKIKNYDVKSFDVPEKFLIFQKNREKRMRMIESYERIKSRIENPIIGKAPKKEAKPQPPQTPLQDNFLKNLLKKKLGMVSLIFSAPKTGGIFCHVCDQHLLPNEEIMHLTSPYHRSQEQKWNELKTYFENEKFIEPFQKVKNVILCLACGAVFDANSFFSHLKGGTHTRKFEWYLNKKETIPISSSFSFKGDFSCFCVFCNAPMSKRPSYASLKTTLKNIRHHWPCPRRKDMKVDLFNELKNILETNKTVVEKNRSLVKEMSVPCATCGKAFKPDEIEAHSENCVKNTVDFDKVEKTVENVANVIEKEIIYNVLDKSVSLLGRVNNLKVGAVKKEIKKSLGMDKKPTELDESLEAADKKEVKKHLEIDKLPNKLEEAVDDKKEIKENLVLDDTPPEFEKPLGVSDKALEPSPQNQIEEKCVKILKNELRAEKTEDKDKNADSVKNEDDMSEHEVLVIDGLPKMKLRSEVIYGKFSPIAKIRYVFFRKKSVILAFTDCSAAEVAAKTPDLFKEYKLTLTITTRKKRENLENKQPELNKDLLPLLNDPKALMDFSLNLIMQAIAMSESPAERKREELVCGTIISAVFESFPSARCYLFGSRVSGLTLNNSDLDVFLDCGGMYDGFKNTTPSSERKLVNKVAALLRKMRDISQMIVVDRARVPIVSFLHKPTLMRCDLSFKNGLSVHNSLLIKFMMSLDWRVRPIILFLKYWVKLNGLHGPPFFSSYAVAMLVIFYLEQLECPVLPTIESLLNSYVGKRITIGGWDCSVNFNQSDFFKSANKDTFPQLLADLFNYYANFNYETNIISPLTGKILPRAAFSSKDFEKLPMCYKRHILNIPAPIENLVNNKILICIVDPFDVSHVLTKSFTSRGLQMFVHLCKASADILKEAIRVLELKEQ